MKGAIFACSAPMMPTAKRQSVTPQAIVVAESVEAATSFVGNGSVGNFSMHPAINNPTMARLKVPTRNGSTMRRLAAPAYIPSL
jgi:hypothetical protein